MSGDDDAKGGLAKTATSSFDQYEIVAVVVPGSALLLGFLLRSHPDVLMGSGKETSIGDLGLLVIGAYVAGQILQSIAEILDRLFWFCLGGLPTDWVVWCKDSPLAVEQRNELQKRVKEKLKGKDTLEAYSGGKNRWCWKKEEWHAVTREMNIAVGLARRTRRIEVFNRTYGLHRGIAVALSILGAFYWIVDDNGWRVGLPILGLAVLVGVRFYLFGKAYARELLLEYLAISG